MLNKMDRRINKTKVKLTQIPEVYSKSYKNILKRVVYARSLQEIGDVKTLIDSINLKWMKENDPNGDRW